MFRSSCCRLHGRWGKSVSDVRFQWGRNHFLKQQSQQWTLHSILACGFIYLFIVGCLLNIKYFTFKNPELSRMDMNLQYWMWPFQIVALHSGLVVSHGVSTGWLTIQEVPLEATPSMESSIVGKYIGLFPFCVISAKACSTILLSPYHLKNMSSYIVGQFYFWNLWRMTCEYRPSKFYFSQN